MPIMLRLPTSDFQLPTNYTIFTRIKIKIFMKILTVNLFITLLTFIFPPLNNFKAAPYEGTLISIPTAGNSWVINDVSPNSKTITSSGITNWNDNSARIRTYFRTEQTGNLNIAVRSKVSSGKSVIQVTVDNEKRNITLTNTVFDTIYIGTFNIDKAGYQWIELQGISKDGSTFAEVTNILISGAATDGKVYFVKDDFYFGRRGPSVHLRYEIPEEVSNIVWFYNEITIPEGNDVMGSYYMANGFADGYFGIQANSPTERRILFSVWSPYKTNNPHDIPDDYKILLIKKGPDVIAKEFGNEGSGGQSYRKFFWETGITYRFLLKGEPSENNSTDYTAYFFDPGSDSWDLIASFRRPKTNNYLKNLYSFLENFIPDTGPLTRKGYYSNQWVLDTGGNWVELTNVRFTADATARKDSRLDYSGGVENGAFFLRNCGFFSNKTEMNLLFSRPKKDSPPVINFSELE